MIRVGQLKKMLGDFSDDLPVVWGTPDDESQGTLVDTLELVIVQSEDIERGTQKMDLFGTSDEDLPEDQEYAVAIFPEWS